MFLRRLADWGNQVLLIHPAKFLGRKYVGIAGSAAPLLQGKGQKQALKRCSMCMVTQSGMHTLRAFSWCAFACVLSRVEGRRL